MISLTLLILAACAALSFLLSGMEAGVFALSRLRVRQQVRAGRPSARVLHEFLENPESFLWAILIGNTLGVCVVLVCAYGFTTLAMLIPAISGLCQPRFKTFAN